MEYRRATTAELEIIWDKNIAENPDDKRYITWKEQFIKDNISKKALTFLVLDNEYPVGEGTLIFSPECKAVINRKLLCNGKNVANINALRIEKPYEGQGHISKLIKEMEKYSLAHNISQLTIGVEAKETRTLAIYLHLGFTEFLMSEMDEGELVLYFGKTL